MELVMWLLSEIRAPAQPSGAPSSRRPRSAGLRFQPLISISLCPREYPDHPARAVRVAIFRCGGAIAAEESRIAGTAPAFAIERGDANQRSMSTAYDEAQWITAYSSPTSLQRVFRS